MPYDTYESKIKAFCDRERILKYIEDYIIFAVKDDELHKYVLRQHQTRAVEKIVERAQDHSRSVCHTGRLTYAGLCWNPWRWNRTGLMVRSSPGARSRRCRSTTATSRLPPGRFSRPCGYGRPEARRCS